MLIGSETDGACVSVKLENAGRALNHVNMYLRHSDRMDGHLRKTVAIIRRKEG